jgi:NAD(P)-dependent dehydrogenase (short-subunit alcohol dehydrogenase family)
MVKISTIRSTNDSLKSSRSGLVAVVVGGTNGLGRGFLKALAKQTDQLKIYIVGRGGSDRLAGIVAELQALNPAGTYIAVPSGDLAVLHEVSAAAARIREREPSHIDVLFQSQGFLTFSSARDDTLEGLDRLTAIRHHGRALFALELLPLLEAAPRGGARVVSVLAAGQEGAVFADDLALHQPAHRGLAAQGGAAASYVTLSMEQLARRHPRVSFVHAFPGFVRTNLFNDTEHIGPVFRFLFNWIVLPVFGRFLWISLDEAGERFLYAATTPKFGAPGSDEDLAVGSNGEKGTGAYALSDRQEPLHSDKVLKPLREQGMDVKIWEYTTSEIERVLGKKFD